MATNVIMPALAQETGKVLRLKAPGYRVAKGDPIVEIETDKVTVAPRHEAYLPPLRRPDRHRDVGVRRLVICG